ncbi:MAG: hypothetical protein DYH13_08540 [Alphaproteobacteria bacterium PRO2]|nr:hypothetical protein [Alphaproteobacteria bacterium PRO2]
MNHGRQSIRKLNRFWTDSQDSRDLDHIWKALAREKQQGRTPGPSLPPAPVNRKEQEHYLTLAYTNSQNVRSFGYFLNLPRMPGTGLFLSAIAADKKDGEWTITYFVTPCLKKEERVSPRNWQKWQFPLPKEIDQAKIMNALVRWSLAANACSAVKGEFPQQLNTQFATIITHQVRSYMTHAFKNSGDLIRLKDIGILTPLEASYECVIGADPLPGHRWKITRFYRGSENDPWNNDTIPTREGTTQGEIMDALSGWAYAAGIRAGGRRKHVPDLNPGAMLVVERHRAHPVPTPNQTTAVPNPPSR